MKTLIVVAHLDDAEIGMGGALALLKGEIKVVVLCKGRAKADRVAREKAFTKNMLSLGFSYKIYEAEDLTLEDFFNGVTYTIQNEVDSFRPDIVYTNSDTDMHRDHKTVAESVKLVCRPRKECSVKELYSFPVTGSNEWNFTPRLFNVCVDITETIEKKLEMCSEYSTEIKSGGIGSLDGIREYHKHIGNIFGYQYAEEFSLVFKR